jgi:uncharacterized coiled-coil DUF342 family protein
MEKFDLLFEMVAKIAQEITELKSEQVKTSREISELREIIASNHQETNTRFDRMEQQLSTVIEQVAGLTEFKNETALQINKLSTIVAEHSADIRLLKKVSSG